MTEPPSRDDLIRAFATYLHCRSGHTIDLGLLDLLSPDERELFDDILDHLIEEKVTARRARKPKPRPWWEKALDALCLALVGAFALSGFGWVASVAGAVLAVVAPLLPTVTWGKEA